MDTAVRDLLRRVARIEPLDEPAGEPGVMLRTESGPTRLCAPVISVYLDMSVQATGGRPEERAGRVMLRSRLHEIAQTFWPRGVAYDAVVADAARIERFLDEQASPAARGVAIFASAQHGFFEKLEVAVPFENEVTVRAEPSLFQLARLVDDRETAVVAVVALNVARLFVTQRGLLREVAGLSDDPKYYHKIRGTNAMNQKRYQRHAEVTRAEFAGEVADMLERLVDREGVAQVILAGEQEALALLRQALTPRIAQLVRERPLRMDVRTPRDVIAEEVEPLLREAEADEDRTVVQRLLAGVQAGELGVAGLEPTRAALQAGQADTLVLSGTAPFPPETRSKLIDLAVRSDARVEIVDSDETLDQMGGVGALLRYRTPSLVGQTARPAPTS